MATAGWCNCLGSTVQYLCYKAFLPVIWDQYAAAWLVPASVPYTECARGSRFLTLNFQGVLYKASMAGKKFACFLAFRFRYIRAFCACFSAARLGTIGHEHSLVWFVQLCPLIVSPGHSKKARYRSCAGSKK